MLRLTNLKLTISRWNGLREGEPGYREKEASLLLKAAAGLLQITEGQINGITIVRKSLDARKEPIQYVYTLDISAKEEKTLLKKNRKLPIEPAPCRSYFFQTARLPQNAPRPVVVGSGPAGLFCAYGLAMAGLRPVVLERGLCVEERVKRVERFWRDETLDPECNVQFGEGGAGTFSDGKLNTMVKDSTGRSRKVMEVLVKHGAPEEIRYLQKPHIGTDRLRRVVAALRRSILEMGGEVRFQSRFTGFSTEQGSLKAIEINGQEELPCEVLVLAVGHSARDTFSMLLRRGVSMGPKPLAIGLRLEHSQAFLNRSQYRESAKLLPPADYKLTAVSSGRRGVYSFCMCPGGFVVNASSEPSGLVVNGMSNYDRGEKNANSAIVVSVTEADFRSECPSACEALAGVEFQRKWERLAYRLGGGHVPVQTLGAFLENRNPGNLEGLLPNIKGGFQTANLNECLPAFVCEAIKEAIPAFDRKIKGFGNPEAVFSGVETRTSSPVRIYRDERLESNVKGIYPCGEGAGYAGGITSSAMDGLRVCEAIAGRFQQK